MANNSSERFTRTLVCNGRVLGSKSAEGVINLLRLHKKKCKTCYDTHYILLYDFSKKTKYVKGDGALKRAQEEQSTMLQKVRDLSTI